MKARRKKTTEKAGLDFEQALAELQQLVERMEEGELSLEDSVQYFARGIELSKRCQAALTEAEQKVQLLMQNNGDADLVDFSTQDDQDD